MEKEIHLFQASQKELLFISTIHNNQKERHFHSICKRYFYILRTENFPQQNNSEKFNICGKITLHYSSDFKNIPSKEHWINMNTNTLCCLIGLMWKSCLCIYESGLGKRTGPSMTKMINNNIKSFPCMISFRENANALFLVYCEEMMWLG